MPPGRSAVATTSTAESTIVRSGTFSFSGVGTQMTNVSLPSISAGRRRRQPSARQRLLEMRSSTSSTGLRPWRRPATRSRSGSYPITRWPASAAAHANGSPT